MKTFDVSFRKKIPEREIEAETAEQAKQLYLSAVLKALDVSQIDAI